MPLDPEGLFREHHTALYRYLVRMCGGDEETAKDAAQHAFLELLERPPEERNIRAWLYTVATNAARDWKRRSRRRTDLLTENEHRIPTPGEEPRPDRIAEAREGARRVQEALNALSERERTIVLLRAEGFRHREIAEAVGTTTGSVGTMAARALEKLSTLLDLDGGEAA